MTGAPGPAIHAPVIGIDQPGSFGHDVFWRRHPRLVEQVLAAVPYPPDVADAARSLLTNSQTGTLAPLTGPGPDLGRWATWTAPWTGRPWSQVPFLAAEAYWYRKLLDAVGYFDPASPWAGVDPFAPAKSAELTDPGMAEHLDTLARAATRPPTARTTALLRTAVWGNRADLSFRLTHTTGDGAGDLLTDHGDRLARLLATGPGQVTVVADNAGRELLADLTLIDHLLDDLAVGAVVLHLKPHPYYVSDATTADVLAGLHRLAQAPGRPRQTAERLGEHLRSGRLELAAHPFSAAPLPYRDMPADLAAEFTASDLVILKGDLQYRRLVGDHHWPAGTPLTALTTYLPAGTRYAALRTLKSDLAAGLDPAALARAASADPDWRTCGRYAVIQTNL